MPHVAEEDLEEEEEESIERSLVCACVRDILQMNNMLARL